MNEPKCTTDGIHSRDFFKTISRSYVSMGDCEDVIRWCTECGAITNETHYDGRVNINNTTFPHTQLCYPKTPLPTLNMGAQLIKIG